MSGIVTLTAAPSIDRSYFVDRLIPGGVHRATRVTEEFAGKGVNVSHGLDLAKIPTTAVTPLPHGDWGKYEATPWLSFSDASVSPRVSITVLEPNGNTTKINQSPPDLTPEDWAAFTTKARAAITQLAPEWVAMCGALPRFTDASPLDVREVTNLARECGALFALDTSGPSLSHWAKQGVPDLIKPNADELAECVGRDLLSFGDVVDAAQEVASWGVSYVVVSLGADGMIGVHGDQVIHARSEPVSVVNTIGAGDSSLAGFLAHCHTSPNDFAGAISVAVAWGAAKVTQPGSQLSSVASLPAVHTVESIDRSFALSEPSLAR